MMRAMRRAALALLGCLLVAAPAAAAPPAPPPHASERSLRRSLEDARALVREGRLEHAELALRRGLEVDPRHARLHRTLADVLDALGRTQEAAQERERADALEPPAAPLPEGPTGLPTEGLLVVVVPPEPDASHLESLLNRWPDGPELAALEQRLGVRLPGARVLRADVESVLAAQAWLAERGARGVLTLRIDRAFCGDSIKDGRFAVGQLRAAAAPAGAAAAATELVRETVFDPGPGCEALALARALERVLASAALRSALAAPPDARGPFRGPVVRELFPGLDRRIEAQLRSGEALLAAGEVEAATAAFRRAAAIDAEDPATRAYLHEAEATLAMARELSKRQGGTGGDSRLDPRLSPEQLAAAEAHLRDEQHRRQQLLAALAVLDEDVRAPEPTLLAELQASEIPDASAFGPSLARRRAGGEVEARAAFAPDGALLARYYFPVGSDQPVLREDDSNGDHHPDRWIAYDGLARSEVWEAPGGDRPTLRIVFTDAGAHVARVEVDDDADSRPNRILHYQAGELVAESRDADGDGRLDTFDRLDTEGRVAVREEDLDGDGTVDVRSTYREGRLVRREEGLGH